VYWGRGGSERNIFLFHFLELFSSRSWHQSFISILIFLEKIFHIRIYNIEYTNIYKHTIIYKICPYIICSYSLLSFIKLLFNRKITIIIRKHKK